LIMRFLDNLPRLPQNEGRFWTHNSGAGHTDKFMNIGCEFNPLRAACLSPTPVDYSDSELFEIMMDDARSKAMFVRHDSAVTSRMPLVAGAIAEYVQRSNFDVLARIREISVAEQWRNRGIGGWILQKAITPALWGMLPPTELSIDTSRYEMPERFIDGLRKMGFMHTCGSVDPAIWLPGQTINLSFESEDKANITRIEELVAKMPDNWNGYQQFSPEQDGRIVLFRGGKQVGYIIETDDEPDYKPKRDERLRRYTGNFRIYNADGEQIDTITDVTTNEAMIALLNLYELLPN
jgi:hypothetical protein